jgi:hypothetical protein
VPKFIIHVGPHKTGSTYIQHRLDENEKLLLKQKIYVPTHWRDSRDNPSHTQLVRSLQGDGASAMAAEFRALHRANHALVAISSEALAGCTTNTLAAIRELLADKEFVIVYYVRRWSELLLSCWNEVIVQGGTIDFLRYVSGSLANPEASDAINMDRQISNFVRIFGRTNVRLVSYDTVIERGGDIFRHFSRHFLTSPNVFPPTQHRANVSTAPEGTELCRILNYIDQEAGNQPSARMTFALRRRSDIDLQPMLSYIRGFQRSILLRDDYNSIQRILRQNRMVYADRFVPPVPVNSSYEPKVVSAGFISSEYMLAKGFAETVRNLWGELLR